MLLELATFHVKTSVAVASFAICRPRCPVQHLKFSLQVPSCFVDGGVSSRILLAQGFSTKADVLRENRVFVCSAEDPYGWPFEAEGRLTGAIRLW